MKTKVLTDKAPSLGAGPFSEFLHPWGGFDPTPLE